MYMAHEEAGLITRSEEAKDRQRNFIWKQVRSMLKGEDHEKKKDVSELVTQAEEIEKMKSHINEYRRMQDLQKNIEDLWKLLHSVGEILITASLNWNRKSVCPR